MKLLLLGIALSFCFLTSTYAESAVAVTDEVVPVKWAVLAHPSGNFSYTYVWDGCAIHMRSAKAGMVVEAVDPNWRGMHITQTIVIEEHPGGASYKLAFTKETGVRNGGVVLSLDTEGYDVFDSRCAEAVKSLPKGIQKAFYGFYGIGGK